MPTILLYDSYDSFTYNLKDYLEQEGAIARVVQNDEMSLAELARLNFDGLVISPGPKKPVEAGNLMEVLDHFHDQMPILGVCLGHQAIGLHNGFNLVKARKPMHGKLSTIVVKENPLFELMPERFLACRYHSLVLEEVLPSRLEIIARSTDGEIMGIHHKDLPVYGVQYHPEAILTQFGQQLLANWLKVVTLHRR